MSSSNIPTVAVASASSNTGLATVRALAVTHRGKARVVAVVRSAEAAAKVRAALPRDASVEIRVGADFADPASVRAALRGVDRVLLVPPVAENRAELTILAATAARDAGVKHIALVSVVSAEHPDALFSRQLREVEAHVESLGVAWTHLRAGFFLENFLASRATIAGEARTFYGSHGEGKFPTIATADIGRSAAVVLTDPLETHAGRAYRLTGPRALSGSEYAAVLSAQLGFPVTYTNYPHEGIEAALPNFGVPVWQAKGIVELYRAYEHNVAPSDDVLRLTGHHTTAEEFVREHREAFLGAAAVEKPLVALVPGTGNVAGATLEALLDEAKRGEDAVRVRVVVRGAKRVAEAKAKIAGRAGFEVVEADLEDEVALAAALAGVDRALITPPTVESRAAIAAAAARVAARAGVKHIVLLSIPVLDEKISSFARSFRALEREVQAVAAAHGARWTFLRATFFAENLFGSKGSIAGEGHALYSSTGAGAVASVTVGDIGRSAAAVLREGAEFHASKAYLLTGAAALTNEEVAATLSRVLGYAVKYVDLPPAATAGALVAVGVPAWQAEGINELFQCARANPTGTVSRDVLALTGKHESVVQWIEAHKALFV